jgi:hypothetical protein
LPVITEDDGITEIRGVFMKNTVKFIGMLALMLIVIPGLFAQQRGQDYSGIWQIQAKNGMFICIQGGSSDNGAAVIQHSSPSTPANTQWRFERQNDGSYTIMNVNSNRFIQVHQSSRETQARIVQQASGGGTSQQWRVEPVDNQHVKFVNVHSGMVLNIPQSEYTRSQSQLIQQEDLGADRQHFRLVPVAAPPAPVTTSNVRDWSGTWQIQAKNGMFICIQGGSRDNGAAVIQHSSPSTPANTQWRFERQSDGSYTIMNLNSRRFMQVHQSSRATQARIVQQASGGGTSQQWRVEPVDNQHVKFVNVHSGMVLNIPQSEYTRSQSQLIQQEDLGADRQHFRLLQVR